MKKILAIPLVISSLLASFVSYAQCTNNPVLQADSKFPTLLRGRLLYHSYNNYSDGSSNLYLKDFRSNTLTQLNQSFWNIEDPMNAHFSPNGRYITFMGKQNSRWNIFIWKIGSLLAPTNLSNNTENSGGTTEDPKFSSDGNYIIYKNKGDIMLSHLRIGYYDNPTIDTTWPITNNGYTTEESMPYLSPDGKSVYYTQGAGQNSDIYKIKFTLKYNQLVIGTPTLVAGRPGVAEFYPISQNSNLFFVGWKDIVSKRDQIYMTTPSIWNNQPNELSLNDCNAENADPMLVDTTNIIFSSTRNNSFYNLYMGNIFTGKVWSLSKFGVNQIDKNQLGATYTNAR